MARRKASARPLSVVPPAGLGREVQAVLADLAARDFDTASLREAIDRLAGLADAPVVAHALLDAALAAAEAERTDLERPAQLATLLVLACGAEAAIAQIPPAAARHPGRWAQTWLLAIADAVGLRGPRPADAMPLPPALVASLRAPLDAGADGLFGLATQFLGMPVLMRVPTLRGFLQALARDPGLPRAVAYLRLVPLDEHSDALLAAWLAEHDPAGARWLAARLAGAGDAGPAPWPAFPLDWPVLEAYASLPDGAGSQGFYVAFRRPDRRLAMLGAVVNDWRGLADGMVAPSLTAKAHRDLVAELEREARIARVPAAYVRRRLDEARARSAAMGLPVPFTCRAYAGMFAGLPEADAPDVPALAAGWADPAALPRTAALADVPGLESWFLVSAQAPALKPFFAEAAAAARPALGGAGGLGAGTASAMEALLANLMAARGAARGAARPAAEVEAALSALVDRWLPVAFDDAARGRWRARLQQTAWLLDRLGDAEARTLAATAAWAIAADSGVPLARQPLPAAILRRSAGRSPAGGPEVLGRALGEAVDALFREAGLATDLVGVLRGLDAPPARTPARRVAGGRGEPASSAASPALTGAEAVYQLKIGLKGARPPIWRRVLVPAAIPLAELHEVVQAAMGWQNYHMYVFKAGGGLYGVPDPELAFRDATRVRLDELAGPGDELGYEYDFGDSWHHVITVEKALPREAGRTYPIALKGKGACPPEDCGGLWGYYEKLDALADPDDPEHDDVAEWMGAAFDPAAFDLAEVNARLARLGPAAPRPRRRKR